MENIEELNGGTLEVEPWRTIREELSDIRAGNFDKVSGFQEIPRTITYTAALVPQEIYNKNVARLIHFLSGVPEGDIELMLISSHDVPECNTLRQSTHLLKSHIHPVDVAGQEGITLWQLGDFYHFARYPLGLPLQANVDIVKYSKGIGSIRDLAHWWNVDEETVAPLLERVWV